MKDNAKIKYIEDKMSSITNVATNAGPNAKMKLKKKYLLLPT